MFRAAITSLFLSVSISASSQDSLSYAEQLRAIELEMDSLSMFNLIDSLFTMESILKSELNIRFSYSSSVTSAGRDYGLNQAGLSPGVAFYHKSGFYGDISSYWNSGSAPKYNPTILSTGYLFVSSSKWSYSFDYEKWLYNPQDSSENPLTNSLGASTSYDFKVGFANIDYSLLFGEETAHRIIGNVSGRINLGKWWIFKDINIYPSTNIMLGNSEITQLRITNRISDDQIKQRLSQLNSFEELANNQKNYLSLLLFGANEQGIISNEERFQLRSKIRNNNDLNENDKQILLRVINSFNQTSEFVESNKFGLLNYSFTLPISLSTTRLNILLSYTYSIPVKLPGEFFSVNPIGYFGASISYRIPLK